MGLQNYKLCQTSKTPSFYQASYVRKILFFQFSCPISANNQILGTSMNTNILLRMFNHARERAKTAHMFERVLS